MQSYSQAIKVHSEDLAIKTTASSVTERVLALRKLAFDDFCKPGCEFVEIHILILLKVAGIIE